MNSEPLLSWIKEREAIRVRRVSGEPPPWTDDPLLREWSFTNVRREDDRVTRWIAEHWRNPHADDSDLWFSMAVARFVNWPDTLAEIGFPAPWNREHFIAALQARSVREKVWGDAYNISNGGKSIPKVDHIAGVLDRLWARRERLRPKADDSLLAWFARLEQEQGLASFMAAQVVADMKYTPPLDKARDWMTFAASGPGSRRGLNRLMGRPVNAPLKEGSWRYHLRRLHEAILPDLERMGLGNLHAQDLQSTLCETDKYLRVKLGEGKPKRRFNGN